MEAKPKYRREDRTTRGTKRQTPPPETPSEKPQYRQEDRISIPGNLLSGIRINHTSAKLNHPASEHPTEYTVWLDVDSQHFCVTPISMTKEEAEWTRTQLATALAHIVISPPPAPAKPEA